MANTNGNLAHLQTAAELHRNSIEQQLPALEVGRIAAFFPSGIQRGSVVEITGVKSSGRTSISLYILGRSITNHEICAYVDLHNQFDPLCLPQSGVSLDRLCWVRCSGNVENAVKSTDLLLHAGGFGLVVLDLCGADAKSLNKIPISYWFRFRRAIEATPTILLICGEQPQARSCGSSALEMHPKKFNWAGIMPYSLLKSVESSANPHRATKARVVSIQPEPLLIYSPLT